MQPLRKGFNEINSTLKLVSKERETQYLYLQKILELVYTGILSYDHKSGNVMWMNKSLKQMLNIPYLKTIHSLEKRDAVIYYNTPVTLDVQKCKTKLVKKEQRH